MQQSQDVGPDPRCSRGTESHHRNSWTQIPELPQTPIIGPEVVPPGTNAMGFIHGKSNQLACCGVLLKDGSRRFSLQSLGSEIEQSKIAVGKLAQDLTTSVGLDATVQTRRGNVTTTELQHLVLHQGDQRRDHHYKP